MHDSILQFNILFIFLSLHIDQQIFKFSLFKLTLLEALYFVHIYIFYDLIYVLSFSKLIFCPFTFNIELATDELVSHELGLWTNYFICIHHQKSICNRLNIIPDFIEAIKGLDWW